MADVANLKIVATADINNLTQGLSKSRAEIAKTALEANKLDKSLGGNLTKGSNSAAFALTNLGRVAQDAPFGFIGIQNNLNPLLESFQRLKAETGSTGSALKALGGSLMGAGGLGLALSAVSAAVLLYQKYTRGSTDEVNENEKAVRLSTSAYDEFLKEIEKTSIVVAGEAAKVSILFTALSDNNIGLRERKGIIEQLNAISPGYLGNLDKEKATYEQITAAVFAYTESLAKSVEIKALLPQVEEIFKKLINAQIELNQLLRFQNGVLGLSDEDFKAESKRLNNQISLYSKQIQQAKKGLEFIAGGALNLSEILFGKTPALSKSKEIKAVTDDLGRLKKVLIEVSEIRFYEKGRFDEFLKNVKPDSKVFNKVTVPIRAEIVLPPLTNTEKDEFFLRGKDLSNALTNGLTQGLEELVEGVAISFGELLGNAMTGSVDIGDFFSGLFNQIGRGLKQLGAYFVKTAIQIKLFKEFATKNPYLALAAGIALVALGTAINNATAKKQAFAKGGLVGGTGNRDTINALLTPGEFVLTKSAVARIGVANLESMNRGIIPAASSLQGISGGGGSMQVEVVGNISGDTIWLANSRAGQRRGRQA